MSKSKKIIIVTLTITFILIIAYIAFLLFSFQQLDSDSNSEVVNKQIEEIGK